MSDRITDYSEFWTFYLGEHRNPVCRGLHYFGTTIGTTTAIYAVVTGTWALIPLALVLGYGPAWIGHFFVEKNKPASFRYPLWSLISDYRMVATFVMGRTRSELERLPAVE